MGVGIKMKNELPDFLKEEYKYRCKYKIKGVFRFLLDKISI